MASRSGVRIIAEVAQGYEGKEDYCRLYVEAAARARADAVKFQIVYADDVAEPGYQYYEWYKTLEMPLDAWKGFRARARDLGLRFFCDVSGSQALDLAAQLETDGIKIHAANFFNRALIRRAFDVTGHVFISLGGIFEDEIAALIDDLAEWGVTSRTTLLYGFQAEPTPVEKSALNRLSMLKQRYPDIEVGYLDHTAGDGPDNHTVSAMAIALGADSIEKHITLSRHLEIEDFPSALEPDEFTDYVASMHRLATALGPLSMALNEDERAYRDKAVKKILTARDMAAGEEISASDLTLRRSDRIAPSSGFHDPSEIVGRRMVTSLAADTPILAEHLE